MKKMCYGIILYDNAVVVVICKKIKFNWKFERSIVELRQKVAFVPLLLSCPFKLRNRLEEIF
jgi:hypothetical protein